MGDSGAIRYGYWKCGVCDFEKDIPSNKNGGEIVRILKMTKRLHAKFCEGGNIACDYSYQDYSKKGGCSNRDREMALKSTNSQISHDTDCPNNRVAERRLMEKWGEKAITLMEGMMERE